MFCRLAIAAVVLFVLSLTAAGITPAWAQEATPGGAACVAPELPPGTPTPMDEATPTAGVEEGESEESPAPAPPVGTPISGPDADAAGAALETLFACVNATDYLAAGALMTANFIRGFLEVPTVYDVPGTFEDVQPVEIRALSNAQAYADGRVSIDAVYTGLFQGPDSLGSERWFFAEEDGILKLDGLQFGVPLPEGALPGATEIALTMVDYAFAVETYTVPENTPLIFTITNESGTGAPHEAVVLTYPEGTTAEQLIQGEVDLEAESTGFVGAVFLEPGTTGVLAFETLAPGTYFLLCFVQTKDGTPHHELGMVSQITVE